MPELMLEGFTGQEGGGRWGGAGSHTMNGTWKGPQERGSRRGSVWLKCGSRQCLGIALGGGCRRGDGSAGLAGCCGGWSLASVEAATTLPLTTL